MVNNQNIPYRTGDVLTGVSSHGEARKRRLELGSLLYGRQADGEVRLAAATVSSV